MTAQPQLRQRVREAANTVVERRNGEDLSSRTETPATRSPVQSIAPGQSRTYGVMGIRGKVTRNMGDYNSVSVEVYCELPFEDGTIQGMRAFYPQLTKEVDHLLGTELALATGEELPPHPDDVQSTS